MSDTMYQAREIKRLYGNERRLLDKLVAAEKLANAAADAMHHLDETYHPDTPEDIDPVYGRLREALAKYWEVAQ